MPVGVSFSFDAVWSLEFVRKSRTENKREEEEEEEENIVYECKRGSGRIEIGAMINDALAEFGEKDDSWIVVVKCAGPCGATENYPLSITHFAQVFYLQRNPSCW